MANKKRMIDANEAYEAVIDLSGQAETKSAYAAFWKAGKEIQKLPTVDAVEVVHGRWKIIDFAGTIKCSVCGEEVFDESNYCPNCGARMDGDEDD